MSYFPTSIVLCLLIGISTSTSAQATKTYSGTHYQLKSDFPVQEAQELLLVIESAWPLLEEFFGKAPKLKKNEKLTVFLFEKYESFNRQILKQKVTPPGPGAGGYYWPPLKTVFQYRQPTVYYTRQLLIHECVHQFHFLSSTKNHTPHDAWFIEGITEYLSRHQWDGATLVLGAVPTISLKDFPARALKIMSHPDYDLGAMVSSMNQSDRAEQWALVHWLCRPNKKAKKKWAKISKHLNDLKPAKTLLRQIIGNSKKTKQEIVAWLRGHQEPMKQVFNQWEGRAKQHLRGFAGVVSMCRTKKHCQSFEAQLVIPQLGTPWRGGLLLHFIDPKNYTVLLVENGRWKIDILRNGAWIPSHKGIFLVNKEAKGLHLAAQQRKKKLQIFLDETMIVELPTTSSPMGLCLDNCTLSFTSVRWTATQP